MKRESKKEGNMRKRFMKTFFSIFAGIGILVSLGVGQNFINNWNETMRIFSEENRHIIVGPADGANFGLTDGIQDALDFLVAQGPNSGSYTVELMPGNHVITSTIIVNSTSLGNVNFIGHGEETFVTGNYPVWVTPLIKLEAGYEGVFRWENMYLPGATTLGDTVGIEISGNKNSVVFRDVIYDESFGGSPAIKVTTGTTGDVWPTVEINGLRWIGGFSYPGQQILLVNGGARVRIHDVQIEPGRGWYLKHYWTVPGIQYNTPLITDSRFVLSDVSGCWNCTFDAMDCTTTYKPQLFESIGTHLPEWTSFEKVSWCGTVSSDETYPFNTPQIDINSAGTAHFWDLYMHMDFDGGSNPGPDMAMLRVNHANAKVILHDASLHSGDFVDVRNVAGSVIMHSGVIGDTVGTFSTGTENSVLQNISTSAPSGSCTNGQTWYHDDNPTDQLYVCVGAIWTAYP